MEGPPDNGKPPGPPLFPAGRAYSPTGLGTGQAMPIMVASQPAPPPFQVISQPGPQSFPSAYPQGGFSSTSPNAASLVYAQQPSQSLATAQGMQSRQGNLSSAGEKESACAFAARTFVLFMIYTIPALAFILCFTELGYGATVYKTLARDYVWPNILGGVGIGLIIFLYIFDFTHWKRTFLPNTRPHHY
jgi:hypothetical protein